MFARVAQAATATVASRPSHAQRAAALAAAATAAGIAAVTPSGCESSKKKVDPHASPKSISELVTTLSTKSRHVFVTGSITDDSARAVIAQLLFLEDAAPGAPILMHINSGGGKVYAGLAIHDVMAAISSPVHTTCLGHCESMAAVLLAAGERGARYALPNSRVMIHKPVHRRQDSHTRSRSAAAAWPATLRLDLQHAALTCHRSRCWRISLALGL